MDFVSGCIATCRSATTARSCFAPAGATRPCAEETLSQFGTDGLYRRDIGRAGMEAVLHGVGHRVHEAREACEAFADAVLLDVAPPPLPVAVLVELPIVHVPP